MIKTLIAKELRMQLPLLIAGVVLFTAPAVFFTTSATLKAIARRFGLEHTEGSSNWFWNSPLDLGNALILGGILSLLMSPAFFAVSSSKERRDRGAEFVWCFQVPVRFIVASKLLVACMCSFLPPLVAVSLAILAYPPDTCADGDSIQAVRLVSMPAAAGCIAWMLGWILRSENISALSAIAGSGGLTLATGSLLEFGRRLGWFGLTNEDLWNAVTAIVTASGIVSLCVGSAIAMRRMGR